MAEHLALAGARQRLVERAACESERGTGHRCAEDVEVAHRQLEALAFPAKEVRNGHAAILEAQCRHRVWRDDVDSLRRRETRRIRVDDDRGDCLGAGLVAGARENDIEVGDAAIGDPGLGAVDDPLVAFAPRARRQRRDIGPCIGLGERERGDGRARGDARQVFFLEGVTAFERDRPAAESLHDKREIGEPGVIGERFAQESDRTHIEFGAAWCAVREEPGLAKVGHEPAADGIRILAMRVVEPGDPLGRLPRKPGVSGLEERPLKMREAIHAG